MTLVERIEAIKNDPDLPLPVKAERMFKLQMGIARPVSNERGDEITRDEWDAMTEDQRQAFMNGDV